MENILRVFVGQHIIGLGNPIIVHTGWSQPIENCSRILPDLQGGCAILQTLSNGV